MADTLRDGAELAWKLLATLEGGFLILATTTLLLYMMRDTLASSSPSTREIRHVLLTSTTDKLGKELKNLLKTKGCTVLSQESDVGNKQIDALIVVGAEPNSRELDGLGDLVYRDVNYNMKVLEELSCRVKQKGCIAWACLGATSGPFSQATAAFDDVIRTNLQRVANIYDCNAIWVGRHLEAKSAAEQIVAALYVSDKPKNSLRKTALKTVHYLCRGLKTVTSDCNT